LSAAADHFFSLGFSKVTMDELAGGLGMSKRTLYEHFKGKRALLRETLLDRVETISAGIETIVEKDDQDLMDKFQRVLGFLGENLPRPTPAFLQDMQRHAPEIWAEVDRRRSQVLRHNFGRLFAEGTRLGLFRETIHPELVVPMFLTLVHGLINPDQLARLPFTAAQVLEVITEVLLRGLLTPEGRRLFEATPGLQE
jgi:AcrR family transcriptional regulator